MSRIYTQNMFLSRPRNMDMDSQSPSVDLTIAVVPSSGIAHSGSEVAQSSHTGSLRNFDINRMPSAMDDDEEDDEEEGEGEAEGGGGTSSAVSCASPFILSGEVDRAQIQDSSMKKTSDDDSNNKSDHEEDEGGGAGQAPPRKKLRLSKEQSALLEESFREHHTLNPKQKSALAKQLNLKSRQVEVWFQNRRARTKLKQTEVDCEFLKRCCESLTEENRRLQREVEELRAIKVAPPCVIAQDFYMPLPAATLTMCPSCERMGSTIDKRALTFAKPSYYVNNIRQPSAAC